MGSKSIKGGSDLKLNVEFEDLAAWKVDVNRNPWTADKSDKKVKIKVKMSKAAQKDKNKTSKLADDLVKEHSKNRNELVKFAKKEKAKQKRVEEFRAFYLGRWVSSFY